MDQSLLEKYRDINVHHEWWDCVYTDFTENMEKIGVEVIDIFFSGFWSQGDGACFIGHIRDLGKYMATLPAESYPTIRRLIEAGGEVYVSWNQRGHYYHEYCTSFSSSNDTFDGLLEYNPGELRVAMAEALDKILEGEVQDFEKEVTEIMRGHMRGLYKQLEAEYDDLTSDEAVWDTIVANELHQDTEDEDDNEEALDDAA